MQIKQRKRINVSLYVIIPLIFSGIPIISILVTYRLITYEQKLSSVDFTQILIWAASLGAVTFVVAFLILWTILKPVEEFVQKTESLNLLPPPSENELVPKKKQRDEVQRYSDVLSQVTNILSKVEARELFPGIIGQSRSIREIFGQIVKVAPTESTVMISGESGTGKELVATAIFEHSTRSKKPFITINCVAIPEGLLESELFGHEKGSFTGAIAQKKGKFELADGGTIFLDEIGDMPLATQAKLLRVLQERVFERVGGTKQIEVDVRFIAATNKDLREMVKEGTFREDLFYRVNVFSIWLPALRERKEDIPALVDHFLNAKEKAKKITPEAMNVLLGYSWPGNVRELRNVIERAAVIAENDIEMMHLPPEVRGESSRIQLKQEFSVTEGNTLDDRLSEIEKGMIIEAITRAGGVQVRAAEILGINQRSLWHRIRKYGIDAAAIKKATKFVD
ncbi:MAG: sigma-54-dependent Fis family transcriptional regulator [Syntrophaceae bacterium]|nr:sigma-54-dependent Fis family transcriptional regulator [Syntrophaceae bacterium]